MPGHEAVILRNWDFTLLVTGSREERNHQGRKGYKLCLKIGECSGTPGKVTVVLTGPDSIGPDRN